MDHLKNLAVNYKSLHAKAPFIAEVDDDDDDDDFANWEW